MYKGTSLPIVMDKGGFYPSKNIDTIPPTHFILGKNLNLVDGGRTKRGGSSHRLASQIDSGSQILGLHWFKLKNGTNKIVVGTASGKLYDSSDLTTAIKTGLTVDKLFQMETFLNQCYICNATNQVQVWTGSGTTTDLTSPHADWGTTSPRQLIKHGQGASERLWAIGVPGYEDKLYYTSDGTDSFVGISPLIIASNEGGIVGAVEFGDRLIVFSKYHAYIVDDTDTDVALWGFAQAQWDGGVASHRLVIKTPNDVVCITPDGDIYSVGAVQSYGDYKAASIARPAFIDTWIRENVTLSTLPTDAFGVYDPVLRAIKIFVKRIGQSEVDTALLYFIDRPPNEAWVIHDNLTSVSGYSASVGCIGYDSNSNTKVLTGGYDGWVWQLEDATKSDNSNGYYSGFTTTYMDFDNPKQKKRYDKLHIITKQEGNYNLNIKVYIDGVYKATKTMNMGLIGSVYGTGQYGTATYSGEDLLQNKVDLRFVGVRISYEIYNQNAGEDFFLSRLVTDFQGLGTKEGY